MQECEICGKEFDYPEYEADKAFGKLFGGDAGCTCDECSEIIVNGSPDDLDRLLEKME